MTDPGASAGALPAGIQLAPAEAALWPAAAARAPSDHRAKRLFFRAASLPLNDPAVQAGIAERLGWLDAPDHFRVQIPALEGFGDGLRADGFTAVVIAGMGGSSLAPEVLLRTFGSPPEWLELRVLDSTDPVAVGAVVDDLDPLA